MDIYNLVKEKLWDWEYKFIVISRQIAQYVCTV
jgi:hypothetical protein